MSVDLSAAALTARIERASELSDLSAHRRLEGKLDMSADGVSRRLREAFELLEFCASLRRVPPPADCGGPAQGQA
jgi:hypothetical protein